MICIDITYIPTMSVNPHTVFDDENSGEEVLHKYRSGRHVGFCKGTPVTDRERIQQNHHSPENIEFQTLDNFLK